MRRVLLLTAALAGCPAAAPMTEPPLPQKHPPLASVVDEVTATITRHASALPAPGRDRRRVDLDALAAIIEDFTGTAWIDGDGVSRWDSLRATLGVPDYLERTNEDLGAAPLFLKYLDDAARAVCAAAVSADLSASLPQRKLLRGPLEAPDVVIADMALRAHGRKLGAADIAAWRQLYDAVLASDGAALQAWTAVCVAMIRHPDFYSH